MTTGLQTDDARSRARGGPARRTADGLPAPRSPLPSVATPTVALLVAGVAVWSVATWAAVTGAAPWWVTVPVHALVTFTMFTVAHEAVHHAASRSPRLNDAVGRIAMPFVASYAGFGMFRYLHIEHHRATNEGLATDPDAWTSHGAWWSLPFRWATIDVWYTRWYLERAGSRPRREVTGLATAAGLSVAGLALAGATGHLGTLVLVYLAPQRLGLTVLAWWFDWLPHHGLSATARTDRLHTTRVRVGLERLMNPLMLYQNYHLVHHLHPSIPFYRYVETWRDDEADYLVHAPPLATPAGRELTTDEYATWRGLRAELEAARGDAEDRRRDREGHPLRVRSVERVADDAVAVDLEVPEHLRERFAHAPGQHVGVRAVVDGEELRRTYSVCSAPSSGRLRIAVRRVDDGRFSGWATTQLAAGDELAVTPPAGSFGPRDVGQRDGRHVVLVAGGSGITPLLAVAHAVLEEEPQSRVTLVRADRGPASEMFSGEVEELARTSAGRLLVRRAHSRGSAAGTDAADADAPHADHRGRLDAEVLHRLLADADRVAADDWYLCGPAPLVEELVEELPARGLAERSAVHVELFGGQPSEPGEGQAARLVLHLDGETSETQVGPEDTLLDAALAVRPETPYSCSGGACGTCRTRLVRGTVAMDASWALEEDEVADDWILACQSRATSDEVEVDYDGGATSRS